MQEVWKAAQQAGLMRQMMDHEHFMKLQGSYVKLSKARNRLQNEREDKTNQLLAALA